MQNGSNQAVARHRERRKRQGLVRVEVQVPTEDAPLLRIIAGALADPARADAARALLRQRLGARGGKSFKALLVAAPLEDIELERSSDPGREVEL